MPESYFVAGFWYGVLIAASGSAVICLWLGLALVAGRIAKGRGYARAAGIAAGVLTGPLAIAAFALLPSRRRVQRANVNIVRRALESDEDVLDEHMEWHFQPPYRESATGDSFRQRAAAIWPLGDDLVVAHVEVAMTVDDIPRQGSSVVVYRLADGAVIEGFDIPSASLFRERVVP